MAKATKKSVIAKTAAARAASAAKYPRSSLVKVAPVSVAKEEAAQDAAEKAEKATAVVVAPTPKRVAPAVATMPKPVTKPTEPSPAAKAASAVRAGKATVRSASQPMVSRRTLIRAENFGYAIKDLRIIAGIAVALVIILVVLHFVLAAKGLA